ncbi:hypothetical protein JCM1840_004800 [Sporobolomyces johnsonii]
MQHSALQHSGNRHWTDVTSQLDRTFHTRDGNPGAKDVKALKQDIREGLGPVWNVQSPEVQNVVIKELSAPRLPSLTRLIDLSKAQWARKREGPDFREVRDIPAPGDSAFQRSEFTAAVNGLKGILGAASKASFIRHRIYSLELTLFRSWEALSEEEIQAAVKVVHSYLDKKDGKVFVGEIIKKAAQLRQLLANATHYVNRYKPGSAARRGAESWWGDLHRDLTKMHGGWYSLDEEQCQTVGEFMTAIASSEHHLFPWKLPRTMASIIDGPNGELTLEQVDVGE